jgi:hypothetical protein
MQQPALATERPAPTLRALLILWPAFVMAGVLEALVFVVVDPSDFRWFGGDALAWSPQAIYTCTFFIFWGVISTATAMTLLLLEGGPRNFGR